MFIWGSISLDLYCWKFSLMAMHERSSKTLFLTIYRVSLRLEKYLNLEGFLEKSLKIKSALKSNGKPLKSLEKSLNSTIFCRA